MMLCEMFIPSGSLLVTTPASGSKLVMGLWSRRMTHVGPDGGYWQACVLNKPINSQSVEAIVVSLNRTLTHEKQIVLPSAVDWSRVVPYQGGTQVISSGNPPLYVLHASPYQDSHTLNCANEYRLTASSDGLRHTIAQQKPDAMKVILYDMRLAESELLDELHAGRAVLLPPNRTLLFGNAKQDDNLWDRAWDLVCAERPENVRSSHMLSPAAHSAQWH